MSKSIFGIELIAIGFAVAVVMYFLLRAAIANPRVRFAYCSFFLGGVGVANLQFIIAYESDGDTVGWSIFLTVLFVGFTSVLAATASARFLKNEKLLAAIVLMTVVLAILQFSGVPYQLLNMYARLYAAICIAAPNVLLFNFFLNSR